MAPANPTAEQLLSAARDIRAAEAAVTAARRALEKADQDRAKVRKKHRRLFPAGEYVEIPGGGEIRRRVTRNTTPSFSLAKYLERYGGATQRMQPFLGKPPKPYDVWDLKD